MDQSTAKKTIFNFGMVLGIKLFLEKNAKELHFGLLNILLLAEKKQLCILPLQVLPGLYVENRTEDLLSSL